MCPHPQLESQIPSIQNPNPRFSKRSLSTTNRNVDLVTIDRWRQDFLKTLELVDHYLGKKAFKIVRPDLTVAGNFNSAMYDAQMVGFAESTSGSIQNRGVPKEQILSGFAELMNDKTFATSVQRATSDETAVDARISKTISMLNGF